MFDKIREKAYTMVMHTIYTPDDLIAAVDEYGILPFWSETGFAASTMSGVSFMKLWYLREKAINTRKLAYGKFVNKKSTFVSLDVLPYLCALRRDGYDFDSLVDEGRVPKREADVMNAIGAEPTPSYELGKKLAIKGYDSIITSLQNKTYLCVTFTKSSMGTAMLSKPEDVFGYDFVRSAYGLTVDENIAEVVKRAPGLSELDEKIRNKALKIAI